MKKILLLSLMIMLVACKASEIRSVTDINTIKKSTEITQKDYRILREAVEKDENAKELRLESLKILYTEDYEDIDFLLENLVFLNNGLKREAVVLILKKDGFVYSKELKIEVLEFLVRVKKYSYFIKKYNYENINFAMIDIEKLLNDNLNKEQLDKVEFIVANKNDYKSFLILVKFDEEDSLEYFIKNKNEWVEKYIIEKKKFMTIDKKLLIANYPKLRNMINEYLKNGTKLEKMRASELIAKSDKEHIKENIFSENYFIQKETIDVYGRENSKKKLRASSVINDSVLRGLSILRDKEAYELIQDKFEDSKDSKYLVMLYLFGTNESYNEVASNFALLENDAKLRLISKMNEYNLSERANFYYKILETEKDFEIRKKCFDGIASEDEKIFIKLTIESLEKNINVEEKDYLLNKVGEVSGEETKNQILKITETKFFKDKVEEEKKILSLSAKIIFWEKYIELYPKSTYIEFINEKLVTYTDKLEMIKKELFNKKNKSLFVVDEKISEYTSHIENESNMERKSMLISKRKKLKEKKKEILSEDFKNRKNELKVYQLEYIEVSDLINSMSHRIYYLKQNTKIKKERIEAMNRDLDQIRIKKSEVLEKLYYLYRDYLGDEMVIGEKVLSEDTLRDLRGMR